jgi:hypothetical protein
MRRMERTRARYSRRCRRERKGMWGAIGGGVLEMERENGKTTRREGAGGVNSSLTLVVCVHASS